MVTPKAVSNASLLAQTAQALVAPGKGILAADECPKTMANRFRNLAVDCTEATRREYRTIAFETPALAEYISGVILHEETLKQKTTAGIPFVQALATRGMLAGITVDKGWVPLPLSPREWITEGLDGIASRLEEARLLGVSFAKWRALIAIPAGGLPSRQCLLANAQALARYAAACQDAGLVPIVEPDISMEGVHSYMRCREATEEALRLTFAALAEQKVLLEGILLKTNMTLAGLSCIEQPSLAEVAESTLAMVKRTVPPAVPGIIFLSGGQTEQEATERLGALNANMPSPPWQLSYAYGRALQASALQAWNGRPENARLCQEALFRRAQLLGAARFGKYSKSLESESER